MNANVFESIFYSSLSHLSYIDINTLKCIKRYKAAFVSDAHQTRCNAALIKGSCVIKHSLVLMLFYLCQNENLTIINRTQSTKTLLFCLAQTLFYPKPGSGSFWESWNSLWAFWKLQLLLQWMWCWSRVSANRLQFLSFSI